MTKARTLADNFAADINGITAGTGITGGGTSGTVTITNDMATTINAKGDLVVGTANDTYSRLAVASTAGYVLTVDSAEATGLKWGAISAGGMTLLSTTALSGTGIQVTNISQSYNHLFISLTEVDMINSVGYVRLRPNNFTTNFFGSGVFLYQNEGGGQALYTVGCNGSEICGPLPYARANDGGSMNMSLIIYNYASTTATKAATLTFGYRATGDTSNAVRQAGGSINGYYYTGSAIDSLNVTLVGSPGSAVFSNPYGTNANVKIYGVK